MRGDNISRSSDEKNIGWWSFTTWGDETISVAFLQTLRWGDQTDTVMKIMTRVRTKFQSGIFV